MKYICCTGHVGVHYLALPTAVALHKSAGPELLAASGNTQECGHSSGSVLNSTGHVVYY